MVKEFLKTKVNKKNLQRTLFEKLLHFAVVEAYFERVRLNLVGLSTSARNAKLRSKKPRIIDLDPASDCAIGAHGFLRSTSIFYVCVQKFQL